MGKKLANYDKLFKAVKMRIRKAQVKAVLSVNAELIYMCRDIGRMIGERQQKEGWGAQVIPKLSRDIRNDLPEIKGFSERNIGYMIRFAREYGSGEILQQPVAKLRKGEIAPQTVAQVTPKIPWGHNILLIEKVKNLTFRLWYMQQTIEQGWSRDVLNLMIKSNAHKRKGKSVTNCNCAALLLLI